MSKTPNKTQYDKFKQAIGKQLNAILVKHHDATWHIYKHLSKEEQDNEFASSTSQIQEVWRGWEDMLKRTIETSLRSLHESIFQFPAPKKMTKEELTVIIWNYRCFHAEDRTKPSETKPGIAKNPLQRRSAIGSRTYRLSVPQSDAKPFTSKAGIACYTIVKAVCQANGGSCTEEQLKPIIMARAIEITPKVESAWRFFQFYRPGLIESQLIIYIK